MTFTVPARRAEILSTHIAPTNGYLNGDNSTDYEHTVSRFGNSTSLYADQVTQLDTTNGYIFRAGYGARGSQTWMMDITKNGVVIRGGQLRMTGPLIFDVEAYANSSDLNTDGTFKINVDATYAINLAHDAMRAATISGNSLGPFGHTKRKLRFNSAVYTVSSPMNGTKLQGCIIESGTGTTKFYCGDSWTNAGAWDSGVSGSGTTVAATGCPMYDGTGSNDNVYRGLVLLGQVLNTAPTTAPSVIPGAGFLFAALEVYSGAWNGTGAAAEYSSNNNQFEHCSTQGHFNLAGWAFINTVIHTMVNCGGQISRDASSACSLAIGQTTLTAAGAFDEASDNTAGGLDSPFYPNPASPASGDERMLRGDGDAAAGALDLYHCEFHDMAALHRGTNGQSNISATIRTYKCNQLNWYGGILSSSNSAGINVQGSGTLLNLDGVDFYDDANGSLTGTAPDHMIFVDGCTLDTLNLRNSVFNAATVVANIGGQGNALFTGGIVENNRLNGTTMFDSNQSFTGTHTSAYLTGRFQMDCGGLAVKVGGSIGTQVELYNPGTITLSDATSTNGATIITSGNLMRRPAGTAGGPSYSWPAGPADGMYLYGPNQVGISANATAALVVSQNATYLRDGSSASAPGLSFLTEGGLGVRRVSSGNGALTAGGGDRLTWNSAGVAVTGTLSSTSTLSSSAGITAGTSVAATTTVTGGTGVTATTGNVQSTAGALVGRKVLGTGTAMNGSGTDFSISAAWGNTATVQSAGGYKLVGFVTIAPSGTGIAANPTITVTWPDSGYATANYWPFLTLVETSDTTLVNMPVCRHTARSTTAMTWEIRFTPVTGQTYRFAWHVMGE